MFQQEYKSGQRAVIDKHPARSDRQFCFLPMSLLKSLAVSLVVDVVAVLSVNCREGNGLCYGIDPLDIMDARKTLIFYD